MIYGRYTILSMDRIKGNKVLCRCSCGTEKYVNIGNLLSGSVKSCGCWRSERMKTTYKERLSNLVISDFTEYLGRTFGKLTVIDAKRLPGNKVLCRCECGNEKTFNFYNVKKGTSSSCGCFKKEFMKQQAKTRFTGQIPQNFIDYTGEQIGIIKVLRRVNDCRLHTTTYLCECECGTKFESEISSLRRSKYEACNCGYSNHTLKTRLQSMIDRCHNKDDPSYKYYGFKGIRVCDEWRKYPIKFIEWSYENGWNHDDKQIGKYRLSIDRIDSDKDYCPSNCQWISLSENSKKAMLKRWGPSDDE